MAFKRHSARLLIHLGLLLATFFALAFVILSGRPGYATAVFLAVVAIVQVRLLIRRINRTNAELARFLDSAAQSDYTQNFSLAALGPSYAALGDAFNRVLGRFRADRAALVTETRYLRALVEHVPVALIAIHADERIEVLNGAARRLFGVAHIGGSDGLAAFGEAFRRDVVQIRPGERKMTKFRLDQLDQHMILSATRVITPGGARSLVAIQNVQSELDATQLAAWQELVRVLTHEIMNSVTPVASLAKTAVDLVRDITPANSPAAREAHTDATDAIATIAQRSEGLIHFVRNYRRLTQSPPPRPVRIEVGKLFERLHRLLEADWKARGITLNITIEPATLALRADADLLEQALLNLLKNAADALAATGAPTVWLSAHLTGRGRTALGVADNGPGVDEAIREKIFVPFYTTRNDGSGVGLALVRQFVQASGGAIAVSTRDGGGASFNILL